MLFHFWTFGLFRTFAAGAALRSQCLKYKKKSQTQIFNINSYSAGASVSLPCTLATSLVAPTYVISIRVYIYFLSFGIFLLPQAFH